MDSLLSDAFLHPHDQSSVVWRYVDTMKLLHCIRTSSLYMTRLDVLDDISEGRMPPGVQEQYKLELQRHNKDLPDHLAQAAVSFLNDEYLKKTIFINSWCIRDCEDALLWYRYASSGFAICSTYDKLVKYAKLNDKESRQVHVSMVQYVDFKNMKIEFDESDDNTWNLFTFPTLKDQIYEGEREVRLIAWKQPNIRNKSKIEKQDWEVHPEGDSIRIDLDQFIDRIVASKSIPDWHVEYVRSQLHDRGLDIPVERSTVAV